MKRQVGSNGRLGVKFARLFLLCFSLLSINGCATYYQPSASQPVEKLQEFSSRSSVALINGQPSTERLSFGGGYYANRNAWTAIAITIADRELTRLGCSIAKDAPKSLTMSIESAKTKTGWALVTSKIVMSAKTSEGYSATYIGQDRSAMAGDPARQMDKALMRVVVEMLNDPQMVNFLR